MSHDDPLRLAARLSIAVAAAVFVAAIRAQQEPPRARRTVVGEQPGELGAISWWRDEQAAQAAALSSKKPVLVLFQEVPG